MKEGFNNIKGFENDSAHQKKVNFGRFGISYKANGLYIAYSAINKDNAIIVGRFNVKVALPLTESNLTIVLDEIMLRKKFRSITPNCFYPIIIDDEASD